MWLWTRGEASLFGGSKLAYKMENICKEIKGNKTTSPQGEQGGAPLYPWSPQTTIYSLLPGLGRKVGINSPQRLPSPDTTPEEDTMKGASQL